MLSVVSEFQKPYFYWKIKIFEILNVWKPKTPELDVTVVRVIRAVKFVPKINCSGHAHGQNSAAYETPSIKSAFAKKNINLHKIKNPDSVVVKKFAI